MSLKLVLMSEIKTEKARTDGKVSRKYYTAYFADAANPFAKGVQRNIFQSHSADGQTASWKGGSPEEVRNFVGKTIPGKIVNCKVKAYEINGRMVDNFTTALLDNENLSSVLKQAGHELIGSEAPATVAESSNALNG